MWIVGHDIEYYPSVYKFANEEDAREKYNEFKQDIEDGAYAEECIYIAEVKEYTRSKEYEMIDCKTNLEIL